MSASLSSAAIVSGDLILGLSDGTLINAGRVQGPQGIQGPPGAVGSTGLKGTDGNTLHTVAGRPRPDLGREGDYAINQVDLEIFGPKQNMGWGSGKSIRPKVPPAEGGTQERDDENERELFGMAPTGVNSGPVTSVGTTTPIENTGTALQPVIAIPAASDTEDGYMSSADKTKLDNLTPGGGTTITGTVPIDATTGAGGAVDISITAATTSAAGSMSAADKTKLDGLSPVTTPNLQLVTDVGNITTREIKVDAVTAATFLRAGNPLGNPNWQAHRERQRLQAGGGVAEL